MRRLILLLCLLALTLMIGVSVTSAQDSSSVVHVVQPGENLYRISLRYGVTIGAIQSANNIENAGLIYVGQQLIIPSGGTTTPPPDTGTPTQPDTDMPSGETTVYVVQRGDTLSAIASRFGTTVQAIASLNGIANPNLIYVGQQLTISGSAPQPDTGTPTNGGDSSPPPNTAPVSGSFELGGHVADFNVAGTMKNIGMSWVKVQINHSLGADPNGPAGIINAVHGQGMKILLGITGNPGQLGSNRAQYIQDYANFVAASAGNGADAIEVWNEPNLDREWPHGQISGASYTEVLRAAYSAIKARNGGTLVISGAPAPTGAEALFPGGVVNDDNFLRQMANAGAGNYMDCLGLHYNEGIVSPTQRSGDPRDNGGYYTRYYPSMVDVYSSIFPGKKLCFTELGYLTSEGYGPLPAGFAWAGNVTLQNQAEWLSQAVSLARRDSRIRLMIIWNVNFTRYDDDPMAGYALIRPGGGCPACNTIAAAMG